jgi:hypothetical protein
MYFPYFRGRQYELLALKELARGGLLGKFVIPVVEPVKLVMKDEKFVVPYKVISTFNIMVQTFIEAKHPMALIYNPNVGDLASIPDSITSLYSYLSANEIIPSVIVNNNTSNCLNELEIKNVSKNAILTVLDNRDSLSVYLNEFGSVSPRYTLFPDERQIRRAVKQNRVMFEDKFNKQQKNADYSEDEFFSEDHLYFADEGYIGFGDYSIIGNEYTEGGWAPRAVAIHIVYFASDNTLRIRHFVSDSDREDVSDVAGKFYEAVSKLADWYSNGQSQQLTSGLETLLNHYYNHTYPGLPTLKKLSIMHHLELVGKYLDREQLI